LTIAHAGVDGVGAFQSSYGAHSFNQILSSSTPAVATALGTNGFSQVAVRLAPPTAPPDLNGVQVIYVGIAGSYSGPDPIGFFISTDQGSTWTQLAAGGAGGTSYGGYAFALAVDPASPGDGIHDTLYFGSIRQWKSTDAGASFSSINAATPTPTRGRSCLRPRRPPPSSGLGPMAVSTCPSMAARASRPRTAAAFRP